MPQELVKSLAAFTGQIVIGGTFSGAEGVWYLVRITAGGNQSSARFGYSKDGGASWFPTNCVSIQPSRSACGT